MHTNILREPLIEKLKFYGDAVKIYEAVLSA